MPLEQLWAGWRGEYVGTGIARFGDVPGDGPVPDEIKDLVINVGLRIHGGHLLMGTDPADLADRWKGLQQWTPGGALDDESLAHYAIDTLTGAGNGLSPISP